MGLPTKEKKDREDVCYLRYATSYEFISISSMDFDFFIVDRYLKYSILSISIFGWEEY